MSLLDDLNAVASDVPAPKGPKPGQASIEWDEATGRGKITSGALTAPPKCWDDLIRHFGFDPDEVQVVEGTVHSRAWDAPIGGGQTKVMHYYKADLERRTASSDVSVDLDEIMAVVLRRKPVVAKPKATAAGVRVVCAADWQIGKSDGDGVEGTVARIAAAIDGAAVAAKGAERIVLAGMGDLVEGCDGHYAMQTFSVALDRREQMRLVRRLLMRAVDAFARIAPVDVVCVPGNHGENRRNGKAFTSWSDNDDVAVFEHVADICASSEKYPDVRFGFPPDGDDLVVTVDAGGPIVAFAHGHQLSGGGAIQQKVQRWWSGQAMGHRPAGDADILVTGHYHHLSVHEGSGRTWLQCPAMDGGSDWWTHQTGQTSAAGMLSFTVGEFPMRPWGALTLT